MATFAAEGRAVIFSALGLRRGAELHASRGKIDGRDFLMPKKRRDDFVNREKLIL
jgi:hypothetical protein